MLKKLSKIIICGSLAVFCTLLANPGQAHNTNAKNAMADTFCMTCYAADFSNYWYQDGTNWKIHDGNGNTIANAWVCDNAATADHSTDTNWYLMDGTGVMYEGIIQDQNGDYYLLNPEHNGTYGMMLTNNGFTFNGVTYQFNQNHDGTFGKILNVQDITGSGLSVTQVNTAGKMNYYTLDFGGNSGGTSSSQGTSSSGTYYIVRYFEDLFFLEMIPSTYDKKKTSNPIYTIDEYVDGYKFMQGYITPTPYYPSGSAMTYTWAKSHEDCDPKYGPIKTAGTLDISQSGCQTLILLYRH